MNISSYGEPKPIPVGELAIVRPRTSTSETPRRASRKSPVMDRSRMQRSLATRTQGLTGRGAAGVILLRFGFAFQPMVWTARTRRKGLARRGWNSRAAGPAESLAVPQNGLRCMTVQHRFGLRFPVCPCSQPSLLDLLPLSHRQRRRNFNSKRNSHEDLAKLDDPIRRY